MIGSTQISWDGLTIDASVDAGAVFLYESKSPRLIFPLEFKQIGKPPEGVAYEIDTVYAVMRLAVGPDQPLVADAIPEPVSQMALQGARHIQLTFPISHEKLHWLEEIRAGASQINFRLFLKVTVRMLGIIPQAEKKPWPFNQPFVYLKSFACNSGEMHIQITRDRWLSYLETAKLGMVHVFEFPSVPLERREELRNAFDALKEAKRLHQMGFYDKAVGECRIALDKFWDEKPKRLKDAWKAYMGTGEHKWLDEAFTAIRRGSNEPHHNARAGHDQFESLVFINLTASLVAYVSRMGVKENQPEN